MDFGYTMASQYAGWAINPEGYFAMCMIEYKNLNRNRIL